MGIKLIGKQKSIRKNEKKNEKSESAPPTNNNPNNELQAIFDPPPTEIQTKCFLEGKRSFVEDRRWAGLRASELVEKKYGGYNEVTNDQLSQSFKQAWEERVTFCKAMKTKLNKTPVKDTGNAEPNDSGEKM